MIRDTQIEVICDHCGGSGDDPDEPWMEGNCGICGGKGYELVNEYEEDVRREGDAQ